MTVVIHLGCNDIPYTEPPAAARKAPKRIRHGKRRSRATARGSETTTGEVATYLENNYGVMEVFWKTHGQWALDEITKALAEQMEALLGGAPAVGVDPFESAMQVIEEKFKDWLSTGEAERSGIPGTPTKASLKRRSLRFKSKKNPNGRPSFIDTGAYEGSFRAWVEQRVK